MGKAMVAAIAVSLVAGFGQGAPNLTGKGDACTGPRHLYISDASGAEGNVPADNQLVFQVRSSGCGVAMVVPFEIGGTETNGPSDVVAGFGSIQYAEGDLAARTITVHVVPDSTPEHDEVFSVWLKHPNVRNVKIDRCVAGGTIVNDDFGVVTEPKVGARLHCSE
ncbi:hypothetical protein DFJ67_5102 [Asanoa ferruginea]|uniref:Calx-beta domain-containing protein n=2 Tax=Asanoa ferruginea TaxID=53367 RepID=A0A3D9ZNY0_9ACTN|nr:hypothetical protein DFJ67_5102 [Asanoa ferruginea]